MEKGGNEGIRITNPTPIEVGLNVSPYEQHVQVGLTAVFGRIDYKVSAPEHVTVNPTPVKSVMQAEPEQEMVDMDDIWYETRFRT